MKHLMIVILCVVIHSPLMAQVKKDSTATTTTAPAEEEKSFPTANLQKINALDISAGLKKTLQGKEYTGWEKATIYFDRRTKEYALLMPDPSAAASKQNKDVAPKVTPKHTGWSYFTYEGQPIDH